MLPFVSNRFPSSGKRKLGIEERAGNAKEGFSTIWKAN
jgi:hypothetical protein